MVPWEKRRWLVGLLAWTLSMVVVPLRAEVLTSSMVEVSLSPLLALNDQSLRRRDGVPMDKEPSSPGRIYYQDPEGKKRHGRRQAMPSTLAPPLPPKKIEAPVPKPLSPAQLTIKPSAISEKPPLSNQTTMVQQTKEPKPPEAPATLLEAKSPAQLVAGKEVAKEPSVPELPAVSSLAEVAQPSGTSEPQLSKPELSKPEVAELAKVKPKQSELGASEAIVLDFGPEQSVLTPSLQTKLDRMVRPISGGASRPQWRITGYSAFGRQEEKTRLLALKRTIALRKYLLSHGWQPEQIMVQIVALDYQVPGSQAHRIELAPL
jgi:outer membrane protein OmpA-like peptidoglycan-associated protein